MKTRYLLPHSLKLPGWIILGIGIVLGIFWLIFWRTLKLPLYMPALYSYDFVKDHFVWFSMVLDNSILNELAGLCLIVGSLFVALSKEKIEDERIMKIRLDSLVWAVLVNSVLFIISLFAVYGLAFLDVMSISIVSIPLLFLLKFKLSLGRETETEINYLLPHSFKTPGWIVLLIGIIYQMVILRYHGMNIFANMPALYNDGFIQGNNGWFKIVPEEQISDELITLFIIIGSLFVALSKEKVEDEFIMKIRLESLLWVLIVNSILMIFTQFSFYGLQFLAVMVFNTISVPILFLIKFKLALRRGY